MCSGRGAPGISTTFSGKSGMSVRLVLLLVSLNPILSQPSSHRSRYHVTDGTLALTVPPERQSPLDRQLYLLEELVRQQFDEEEDIGASLVGDQQASDSVGIIATDNWLDSPSSVRSMGRGANGRAPGRLGAVTGSIRALCPRRAPAGSCP